jgi:hypothetical protein
MTVGAGVNRNFGQESRLFTDGSRACRMDKQEHNNVATI